MPCDTQLSEYQTLQQRQREIDAAVAKLEAALGAGTVKVVVGPTGSVAFAGWTGERDGVTDLCAYRKLSAKGSWALRQAVARAEGLAGRKVNPQAVNAGVHSHDGGHTWGKH